MSNFLLDLNNEGKKESIIDNLKIFFVKLKGVVISPTETMKTIHEKPNLIFPVILMLLVIIGTLFLNTTPYKDYTRAEILKTNIHDKVVMTAQEVEQEVDKSSNFRYLAIPNITILIWIAGTAILYLFIRIAGGKSKFKGFLVITGYAYITLIFGGILQAVVVSATGQYLQEFNITSIGYYLPKSLKGNFFYGMAGGIELFKIWNYYLVGIGVCYLTNLSKRKVYTIIFAMFLWPVFFGGFGEVMVAMVK